MVRVARRQVERRAALQVGAVEVLLIGVLAGRATDAEVEEFAGLGVDLDDLLHDAGAARHRVERAAGRQVDQVKLVEAAPLRSPEGPVLIEVVAVAAPVGEDELRILLDEQRPPAAGVGREFDDPVAREAALHVVAAEPTAVRGPVEAIRVHRQREDFP